jgi:uncharacterized membrane protein YesL
MNLFSYDGLFARFLYLVADIVTLHVLWVLCSLPLFTIGASITALSYACMKRIRTNEGYAWKNFLKAFKENFRQSTLIWLIVAGVGMLLYLDMQIARSLDGALGTFMLVSCSVLLIPYVLVTLYIFPVQAKFENPIAVNFKNALLISLQSFGYSLLLLVVLGTFVVLTLFFTPLMGLMLVCGAGLVGYLLSCIFVLVFRRYLPNEVEHDAEAAGIYELR